MDYMGLIINYLNKRRGGGGERRHICVYIFEVSNWFVARGLGGAVVEDE